MTDVLAQARDWARESGAILVLTGAGVSAESGVPTFRGEQGLWKHYRPEELATPDAFVRDPRLVWEWYEWRRRLVLDCRPNAAHSALAAAALRANGRTRIVTQNVDGLHAVAAREAAASLKPPVSPDAALPVELHGSLFRTRCTSCGDTKRHTEPIDASSTDSLPRCARCHSLLRPDVVWFGESLDESVLSQAFESAAAADVCFVIGTSAVVQPAASLALVTKRAGGRVVEVNPDTTPLTALADLSLRSRAGDAVPSIF